MWSFLDLLYSKGSTLVLMLGYMSLMANDWSLEVHPIPLTTFPMFSFSTKHFSLGYIESYEVLASSYISLNYGFPRASNKPFTLI